MNKKILVTGGSGYLGTHVRQYFDADNLSRRVGKDLSQPNSLQNIDNYDLIIHMAALVDKREQASDNVLAVNVQGTINLLQRLEAGQTLIFCSTKDIYGSHIDAYKAVPESCPTDYCGQGAYEWSKLLAEKYIEYYAAKKGVRFGIFRLSTVYGPATPGNSGGFVSFFARAIQTGLPLRLKMGGAQVRDLLHVNDLARAFELFMASTLTKGCYNIGGGAPNALTLYELTQVLSRLTGQSAKLELSDEPVSEQIHYITDISKLAAELAWQPKLSIEAGLQTLLS